MDEVRRSAGRPRRAPNRNLEQEEVSMISWLNVTKISIGVLLCGGYIGLIALLATRWRARISWPWVTFLLVCGTLVGYCTIEFCVWFSDGYFTYYGNSPSGRRADIYGIFVALLCLAPYVSSDRRVLLLTSLPLFSAAFWQFLYSDPNDIHYAGLLLFAIITGALSATKIPIPTILFKILVKYIEVLPEGSSGVGKSQSRRDPYTMYRQVEGGGVRPVRYLGIGLYQDSAGNRYKGGGVGKLKKL